MGAIRIIRRLRDLLDVNDTGTADGDVPTWNAGTGKFTMEAGGSGGGPPSGPAGGVLSGTYPDPGFAADMATQAELNTHESDTSSVHGITDTTVLATDAEVAAAVAAHTGDAADAHDASAISVADAGGYFPGDDVEEVLEDIGEAWTTYTPTWASTGTQPAVGNGSIVGAYKKIGKTLMVRVGLTMGSTTTFGTGTYTFSLPSGNSILAAQRQIGQGLGFDAGTAWRDGIAMVEGGGSVFSILPDAGATAWSNTIPHTWASGDALYIQATLEVA